MSKIILYTLFFFIIFLNLNAKENHIINKDENYMNISNNSIALEERYSFFPSGASYIKIRIKDVTTMKNINMIVENIDFASYLASERGLKTDKLGRFLDNDSFIKFREKDYVDYMVKNHDKRLEINLDSFQRIIGKCHFGKEKAGKKYLENFIFDAPMSFKQLGVKNERELIDKYFDSNKSFGQIRNEYHKRYSLNPSFIAFLIDLGYLVYQTDLVPTLIIQK